MSEAQSAARIRMLTQRGWLYAGFSRYCDWVKIGFTIRRPVERLNECASRYPHFGPFSLIGTLRSTWAAEQQIHRVLSPFRHNRVAITAELYPSSPSLVGAVRKILDNDEWLPLPADHAIEVRKWARGAAKHPANEEIAREAFAYFDLDHLKRERVA